MTTELDKKTLEWAAQWLEGSLKGEFNERVREFGRNMAMTLRAAKLPDSRAAIATPVDAEASIAERLAEIEGACNDTLLDVYDLSIANASLSPSYARETADCIGNKVGKIRKAVAAIRAATPSLPSVVPIGESGISWTALLRVLERLRSKNRNPDNVWYHGWNAAIQCLINDINARAATPVAVGEGEQSQKLVETFLQEVYNGTAHEHRRSVLMEFASWVGSRSAAVPERDLAYADGYKDGFRQGKQSRSEENNK